LAAIGGKDEVQRFTDRALARMGSGLEARKRGFKAPLAGLPEDVRERLEAEGLTGTLLVDFDHPPPARCRFVSRSHPLVSVLAETLLERTLAHGANDEARDPSVLGRVGCWHSAAVTAKTTLALVRLRHQLVTQRDKRTTTLLVEEAGAFAWSRAGELDGDEALALLTAPPCGDVPPHVQPRHL